MSLLWEKHLNELAYKVSKVKCEECEYFAPKHISLEVHAGKTHSGSFECVLCEFKGKDVEDLEHIFILFQNYPT